MRLRLGITAACVAIFLISISAFGQTTAAYQYVFPRVTSGGSSQIIISNLSARPATAQVDFLDSSASQRTFVDLAAGTESRVVVPFDGTAIVSSPTPLSAIVRLVDSSNNPETLAPATPGSSLIIPFGQGTSGDVEISVFNPSVGNANIVIAAM